MNISEQTLLLLPHPGLQSLVSGKCTVAPKSRRGLCAWWLPLWGVSCPGHSPAARTPPAAAENGLAGDSGDKLGYRVTRTHTYEHTLNYIFLFLCFVLWVSSLRSRCIDRCLLCLGNLMARDTSYVNGFGVSQSKVSDYWGWVGTVTSVWQLNDT